MATLLQVAADFANDHWVSLVIGFLIIMLYRSWDYYRFFKKRGIAGPTPLPLVGNLAFAFVKPNEIPKKHVEWYNKYGKVFGIFMFREPFLMVADLDMIKEIFIKEFPKFHDRKALIELPEPYDRVLTVVQGQKWKDIRSTLSPTFSALKMKQMMPFMNEAVDTFLQKLEKISKTREIVDIHRWLQSLTMDVILSTAFGVKAETQTVENDPITEKAKKPMAPNPLVMLMLMLPFGDHLLKLFRDPFHFDKIGSVAADIIAQRTKEGKGHRKDMLQLMLDAKEETGGGKVDKGDIQAQSVTFLLAGYETSSTTLGFVCYHLALDTHVQDKLRDEIDSLWTGEEDSPSYDILHKMEYLDMVINEAIRMYPPSFLLQRDCTESCTVQGVHIPKGLPVLVPCYAIHHDPEIWPEPEKFDPERFSETEKAKRHPYAFMPFGFGPRNCVGMRFALLEIKLTLVKLLKKFKIERTEKTVIPLDFVIGTVLTCPREKIMLRASPRD